MIKSLMMIFNLKYIEPMYHQTTAYGKTKKEVLSTFGSRLCKKLQDTLPMT